MPARGKPRTVRSSTISPQAPELDPSLRDADHQIVEPGDVWEAERVVGADLTGIVVKNVQMTGCELLRVACTGAHIELLSLADVVMTDCELSGAVLSKASLRRVELRNCRLAGVVLSDSQLRDVRFVSCKLDGANFRFATAQHVVFDDCSLAEADFTGAQLEAVKFERCDLRNSDYSRASATNTRLRGSTVDGLRGAATLGGITVDSTQVVPLALGVFAELGIAIDDGPE